MATTEVSDLLTDKVSQPLSWFYQWSNQTGTVLFAVFLVLLYICFEKYWTKGKHPLPPGPRGLPLVGSLPFLDSQLHRCFAKLSHVYGPIMKLKLGSKITIVISSPSMAKEVLKDQDTIFANRDVPAVTMAFNGGQGPVWSPYGSNWRILRKICVTELISNKSLDSFYGLRRREVRQMVREVYDKKGTPLDVGKQLFLTTLNLMMSVLWGGTSDGEKMRSIGIQFRGVFNEIVEIAGKPNVSDFFPVLARFDLQGLVRDIKKQTKWLDQIFESLIDHRLKTEREGDSKDFLQVLLRLLKEGGEPSLTMNKLKASLAEIVIAGTDTTSTTLEWAMAEMLQHPDIMRRVREEVEEVVGIDNIVEESHVPKLTYLGCVLKEVLRLHPVVPFLVPHKPSESCIVGNYMVPKGSQVLVNTWAIQTDPETWDNPLEFQPERFLGTSGNKFGFIGNNFSYLPFGSGRRVCLGIPLAERVIIYGLASLVHSFDWRLPEGTKLDLADTFGISLKKATPLVAIPMPRSSKPEFYS